MNVKLLKCGPLAVFLSVLTESWCTCSDLDVTKALPEVLVFGRVKQKGNEGDCKSLSQIQEVVHEKVNEHHNIEVSQFLS